VWKEQLPVRKRKFSHRLLLHHSGRRAAAENLCSAVAGEADSSVGEESSERSRAKACDQKWKFYAPYRFSGADPAGASADFRNRI